MTPVSRRSRIRLLMGAAGLAVVIAGGIVVAGLGPSGGPPDTSPPSSAYRAGIDAQVLRVNRSQRAMQALLRAWTGDSEAAFLRLFELEPASQRLGRMLYHNAVALHLAHLSQQVLNATPGGVSVAGLDRFGGLVWTAETVIDWRIGGIDDRDATAGLEVTFVRHGDGPVRVVTMRAPAHGRLAPWLIGPLTVRRTDRTLVAAVGTAGAGEVSAYAARAVHAVSDVLDRWHGDLVIYVPRDQDQLERMLAVPAGSYSQIAGVATTTDGRSFTSSPVAIMLNTTAWEPLSTLGKQVVITHEATHVAAGGTKIGAPTWLNEGFADYVAIKASGLSVAEAAQGAIEQIRQSGVPRRLPTISQFDSEAPNLEDAYEESWLATRLISRTYGERKLVSFVHWFISHPGGAELGFRRVLGTTEHAFTTRWRSYLKTVARAG